MTHWEGTVPPSPSLHRLPESSPAARRENPQPTHGESLDEIRHQMEELMNPFTSYAAASLLLVGSMACQKTEQPPPVAQETAAPEQTPAAPHPATAPYDLQFLDTMSAHHASAIQMATMAHGSIQQPQLKQLVKSIPGDQQKETDQMKAWRDQWYPGAAKAREHDHAGHERQHEHGHVAHAVDATGTCV